MTDDRRSSIKDLSILIVEDNAFTVMTVRKTLESLGLTRVQVASNGIEALEVQADAEIPPDVLLLDLRMPGMGGLELLGRLSDRRFSGYIIVTSGVDEETMESVRKIASAGNMNVLGFLPKPLTTAVLRELLETAV